MLMRPNKAEAVVQAYTARVFCLCACALAIPPSCVAVVGSTGFSDKKKGLRFFIGPQAMVVIARSSYKRDGCKAELSEFYCIK